jgi:hypothetical protein
MDGFFKATAWGKCVFIKHGYLPGIGSTYKELVPTRHLA